MPQITTPKWSGPPRPTGKVFSSYIVTLQIKSSDFNADLCHFLPGNMETTTTEPPMTQSPPMNTTYYPASSAAYDPPSNTTIGVFNSSEISMNTSLSNNSSVPYNSSNAPQWTSAAPYTTAELPLPTTTCSKKCHLFVNYFDGSQSSMSSILFALAFCSWRRFTSHLKWSLRFSSILCQWREVNHQVNTGSLPTRTSLKTKQSPWMSDKISLRLNTAGQTLSKPSK